MNQLIVLVGIPGSGKSMFANKYKTDNSETIVLSSDELREELLGNVNDQSKNTDVFTELFNRAETYLKQDKTVIIDATNINRKKRKSMLSKFNFVDRKICIYIDTPFDVCCKRNNKRERVVPQSVMDNMYQNMHMPHYNEGWDDIYIEHYNKNSQDDIDDIKHRINNTILKPMTYEDMICTDMKEFSCIIDLPHDNPYHPLSVSRHTYSVYTQVYEALKEYAFSEETDLKILWSALLHDIGKAHTKSFKDDSMYAQYLRHENVSAQLACSLLSKLGYDDKFILEVCQLCLQHMRLYNNQTTETLIKDVGTDVYTYLKILNKADDNADWGLYNGKQFKLDIIKAG